MPAIHVENLGKRYRLNHLADRAQYNTLRDTLADTLSAPWRRWKNGAQAGRTEEFWALKDVSFDIEPGEVVGVIGRNGAGKSTLLKVLSRITKPTTGQATIHGRVASLLEVGTGFNPELTGRENIYLSGAILGMGRREIDRKFDEIVDFSGVERFIDTPVKRYSSGMTVRLGFAVAAHLEPEILLVDEVLAVGDAQFQAKCLRHINRLCAEGKTIMLVSHQLEAVKRSCPRVLVLTAGDVRYDGDPMTAIAIYGQLTEPASKEPVRTAPPVSENQSVVVTAVDTYTANGSAANIEQGEMARFVIRFHVTEPVQNPIFDISFRSKDGQVYTGCNTSYDSFKTGTLSPGAGAVEVVFPYFGLEPGGYDINVSILGSDGIYAYDWRPQFSFCTVSGKKRLVGRWELLHTWRL